MRIFGYTIIKTKKYEEITGKLAEIICSYKRLSDLHHKAGQKRDSNGRFVKNQK